MILCDHKVYMLVLLGVLCAPIEERSISVAESPLIQQSEQRLDMRSVGQRSIRLWFSLQEQVSLSEAQREQLWQSVAEILQLYAVPDLERYNQYLQRRKGHLLFPSEFYQQWQEHYGAGKGVWQELIGVGQIEIFHSEQPVTPFHVLQYIHIRESSQSELALGRYSTFPGESERPCLYALVRFVAAPPPLPPGSAMEVQLPFCEQVRRFPMSDAPRTYFLWLRWDVQTGHWWIDIAGVDRADARPRHYDLLF